MTIEQARALAREARTMALAMDFVLRGVRGQLVTEAPVRSTRRQVSRRFAARASDRPAGARG